MVEGRSRKSSSMSSKSSNSTASLRKKLAAPTQGLDFLQVEGDDEYQKQFVNQDAEIVVMFSGKIWKWNKYSMKQERSLVITNINCYNFHRKKLKRVIGIKSLSGVTKALNEKSDEFVVHVRDDYDYRLESKERGDVLLTLKMAYLSLCKENLPIFGIPRVKGLNDFCTSEKDSSRGINRMPMILARLYEEDIKIEKRSKTGAQSILSPQSQKKVDFTEAESMMENITVNLEHRQTAQRNSQIKLNSSHDFAFASKRTLDADFTFDDIFENRAQSSTLYRRDTLVEATFEDFELISIVGRGTFGKVYLVRKSLDQKLFAMKVIRKDVVIQHESLESLNLEKLILVQVNHPFIIGLNYVFQKTFRIYFIMDFIQGGELFKHLTDEKRFSEYKAKFYAAQIALALGYLHESKIIYRDLKPENILLNKDGYIMLADFGLAKIIQSNGEDPNSFCGTPEYLSPEMILGSGHDHTLDWWALGILIYEMIIGIPPFYNQNKHQMYNLIQHAPIRWPKMDKHGIEVSKEGRDLISKMLNKDRHQRLGQEQDVSDILSHPWFAGLNIEDLLAKKIPAPFVPEIKGKRDLTNFDPEVTQEALEESLVPEESKHLINQQKDAFAGFGPMEKSKRQLQVQDL